MHTHPFFSAITILDDDDLAAALGSEVVERRTVHEWPLTCTHEIRLADGRRFAYKAQIPPTVEPEFYAAGTSPLLVDMHDLGRTGETRHLVTEWLDATHLNELASDETTILRHARAVSEAISAIEGDPPVFLDLADAESWREIVTGTVARLEELIADGHFPALPASTSERLAEWARRPEVRAAASERPAIVHGDLSPEEVFVLADGYRVIDWQRPVRGPADIDVVSILVHSGIDPRPHVDDVVVGIAAFVLVHWASIAPGLVPDAPPTAFQNWAREALERILGPL